MRCWHCCQKRDGEEGARKDVGDPVTGEATPALIWKPKQKGGKTSSLNEGEGKGINSSEVTFPLSRNVSKKSEKHEAAKLSVCRDAFSFVVWLRLCFVLFLKVEEGKGDKTIDDVARTCRGKQWFQSVDLLVSTLKGDSSRNSVFATAQ